MPHEMLLHAAEPVCVQAVRAYAAEVAQATPLRPVVTTAEDAADVVFLDDGPPVTALRVQWACQGSGEADPDRQWDSPAEPADKDAGDGSEHALLHCARTMAALARNAEAAGAFLQARKPERRLAKRRRPLRRGRRRQNRKGKP